MKTTFTFLISVLLLIGKVALPASFTVVNSGFTFSPAVLTINVNDVVTFTLGPIHNVVEVSKATWDANGNTSNGGFTLPLGGGTLTFNTAGTYYYVCAPHASLGMKGQIIVTAVTGIEEKNNQSGDFLRIFPNPATDFFNLSFKISIPTDVKIDIMDIAGRRVKSLIASNYSTGSYTLRFPVTGLIPGRYIIRYQHGDKTEAALLVFPGTR